MDEANHDTPLTIPEPPVCKSCGAELHVARDRITRQPVVRGGRAMMRCSACHRVSIGDHHPTVVARYKRYNVLVWAGSIVGGVMLVIHEFLGMIVRLMEFGVSELVFAPILQHAALVLGTLVLLHMGLRCAAAAIDPLNRSNRVEALAMAIFWAIATAGCVTLLGILPAMEPPVAK
ncbi:MAG: hypothetical protein K2X32_02310 [Phycisphaerales bacterium]|nr:hypothetical protein [Phycisphaerales bacterium]